MTARLAVVGLALLLAAGTAQAERIFYRSGTWLETPIPVQRLSLLGVLRAWERLATAAEAEAPAAGHRAVIRLHQCLAGRAYTVDHLLERLTVFGVAEPERVYSSVSAFIAEGVRGLCGL